MANKQHLVIESLNANKHRAVVVGGAVTTQVSRPVAEAPVGLAHQLEQGARNRLKY
jgi:hypothetical protein